MNGWLDLVLSILWTRAHARAFRPLNSVNSYVQRGLNPFFRTAGLPEIRCGEGIDYGPVTIEKVGLRGDNQFSMSGLTMSFAAKLQGAADGGEILVGEDVANRLTPDWKKYVRPPPNDYKYKYPGYRLAAEWQG